VPKHIAFDFDKTLATYNKWEGHDVLGDAIYDMVVLARRHLDAGDAVYIFTARVSERDHSPADIAKAVGAIEDWCEDVFGQVLPITACKLTRFSAFYDDRAVQVIPNQGVTVESLLHRILNVIHHDVGQTTTAIGLVESVESAESIHAALWERCMRAEASLAAGGQPHAKA